MKVTEFTSRASRAQRIFFIVCCCISLLEMLRVLIARLDVIVQYVPDDAFYYLEISRNLARIGLSSQDGGQTVTTGYHLLWAWILEGIAHLVHYDRMWLLRSAVLLSWLFAMGTVFLIARLAWRNSVPLLSVLILFVSSQSFLCNSVSGLEWSLTVFVSAAALLVLLRTATHPASRFWTAFLVGTGLVGSLARSDFGGQACCYLIAAMVVFLVRRDRRFLPPAFSLMFGSVVGLGLTFLHDWLLTGDLIQGSARMKSLWAAAAGRSPLPFFPVLIRTVLFLPTTHRKLAHEAITAVNTHAAAGQGASTSSASLMLTTLALLFALAFFLCGWSYLVLRMSPVDDPGIPSTTRIFLAVGGSSIVMLYAIVDTFNSFALQIWYTSQVTVAVGILLYLLLTSGVLRLRRNVLYAGFTLLSIINLLSFALSKPKFYVQAAGPASADAMKQQLGPGAIGLGDTGVTNFAYGGTIINLDGLVNNEVIAYAPDRLPCYLLDKKIRYFNGFGEASNAAFHLQPFTDYATLVPIHLPDGATHNVYETDPRRLAALPICAKRN